VFFTEAVGITSDNRLAAGASDRTSYRFALPSSDARIEVRARVIYRRAWRALVDAKGWTEDGHGGPLADVAPPHFGQLMEQATRELDFVAPTPDAGLDGGLDGGALSDGGPGDAERSGCGCRAGGGRSSAALTFLLFVALRRRRAARAV
jgi:hypothetical protein